MTAAWVCECGRRNFGAACYGGCGKERPAAKDREGGLPLPTAGAARPESLTPSRDAAYRQQRLLRIRLGSSLPMFWRFVQWVGKETNPLTGEWEDVVLCEYDPEWSE